jgi:hypothetical protein
MSKHVKRRSYPEAVRPRGLLVSIQWNICGDIIGTLRGNGILVGA